MVHRLKDGADHFWDCALNRRLRLVERSEEHPLTYYYRPEKETTPGLFYLRLLNSGTAIYRFDRTPDGFHLTRTLLWQTACKLSRWNSSVVLWTLEDRADRALALSFDHVLTVYNSEGKVLRDRFHPRLVFKLSVLGGHVVCLYHSRSGAKVCVFQNNSDLKRMARFAGTDVVELPDATDFPRHGQTPSPFLPEIVRRRRCSCRYVVFLGRGLEFSLRDADWVELYRMNAQSSVPYFQGLAAVVGWQWVLLTRTPRGDRQFVVWSRWWDPFWCHAAPLCNEPKHGLGSILWEGKSIHSPGVLFLHKEDRILRFAPWQLARFGRRALLFKNFSFALTRFCFSKSLVNACAWQLRETPLNLEWLPEDLARLLPRVSSSKS